MNTSRHTSSEILDVSTALLSSCIPGLSTTVLMKALETYNEGNKSAEKQSPRPVITTGNRQITRHVFVEQSSFLNRIESENGAKTSTHAPTILWLGQRQATPFPLATTNFKEVQK